MPSADEANKSGSPLPQLRQAPLLAAGMMLAERGIYGMVWVDEDLYVTARYGRLVNFIDICEPLTSQLLPLIGLEDEIRALKNNKGSILELPGIAIIGADGEAPKLNIAVYWSVEETCYLVVLTRYASRSDVEIELSRQTRARLIAEAEVTHTSKILAKTNTELERANRDLAEFASIISHDLKAPMRMLRYIIDDVEAALAAGEKAVAEAKLADMRAQSRRMSQMMTALLEYSSAGRKEEIAEEVDTQALAQAIVTSMRRTPGFSIEIRGLWPAVLTVAAPLDLVLRNLIDNAIKHHDRAEGKVELTGSDKGNYLEISVADDGPGIARDEHEAVFLPFRRLAAAGAEGQGMGLAFVKRWVEAAGGRLELESDPEVRRGTTFRLTWPKMAPA